MSSVKFYGSINLSKLIAEAKAANKAITKSEKGDVFVNCEFWTKDEPDQYGNQASIRTNFKGAEKNDRVYFGNFKLSVQSEPKQVTAADVPDLEDLPW